MADVTQSARIPTARLYIKSIAAIILFFILHSGLLVLTFLFLAAFVLSGMMAIKALSFIAALPILAAGIVGVVHLLYLLLAIPFPKIKTDVSQMIVIQETDQPILFALLRDIAAKTGSDMPHKVYLSNENNAFIFPESPLLSLFFYNNTSLNIGYSLLCSVNVSELRAIIAHEMGHLRNHNLSIGGYVYQLNKILFDMLYAKQAENQSDLFWIQPVISSYRQLLEKVYQQINVHFLSLSRQMEFDADDVSAHCAGGKYLIQYLLRNEFIDICFSRMALVHADMLKKKEKTTNIYPQFRYVLERTALINQIETSNGIPMIPVDFISRFNKSTLVVENQWASHPSLRERIKNIQHHESIPEDERCSTCLIQNSLALENKLTAFYYATEDTSDTPFQPVSDTLFIRQFEKESREAALPECFRGYYHNRNPYLPDEDECRIAKPDTIENLFSDEKVNNIYLQISLEKDKVILQNIQAGNTAYQTFDYDGKRYSAKDAESILKEINKRLRDIARKNTQNDCAIYLSFYQLADQQKKTETMQMLYNTLSELDRDYPRMNEILQQMQTLQEYMQQEVEIADSKALEEAEEKFRQSICLFPEHELYREGYIPEIREALELFLAYPTPRGADSKQVSDYWERLENATEAFRFVIEESYFKQKKKLLDFQAGLLLAKEIAERQPA